MTFGYDIDEAELLKEFEKMLNGDDNSYDEKKAKQLNKQAGCLHSWEKTGESPTFGTDWFNCSKCSIKQEEYEKSK